MEENNSKSTPKNNFVLLDISLFVLGLIDPDKIVLNNPSDTVVLEIPGALVTMILSAKAELTQNHKPILLHFIEAYVKSFYSEKSHQDVENFSKYIFFERILKYFDLFEGVDTFVKSPEKESEQPFAKGTTKSIRRYEPAVSTSSSDISMLRSAYTQQFGVKSHPLIELYFLQVYHSEFANFNRKVPKKSNRQLVCAGSGTINVVRKWNNWNIIHGEHTSQPDIKKYQSVASTPSLNSHQPSFSAERRLLGNIVSGYFHENWREILVNVGVSVALVVATTGTFGLVDVALAVVSFTSTELIVYGTSPAYLQPAERGVFIVLGILLIIFIYLIFRPKISLPFFSVLPTPTLQSTQNPDKLIKLSSIQTPAAQFFPTDETSLTINNPQTNQNADHCQYVIQQGDTVQSVATRFKVSEDSIKVSNPSLNNEIFSVHRAIRIESSCCAPINNQGYSYIVVQGETLYTIAKQHFSSVDAIVWANNLSDPTYIRTGQMLCIPFP